MPQDTKERRDGQRTSKASDDPDSGSLAGVQGVRTSKTVLTVGPAAGTGSATPP